MAAQQRWVVAMRAHACALRFRLPWTPGATEYLDGELRLPVWGGQTTTESRLVCTDLGSGSATKAYDNQRYEGQMFHFNTVTRVQIYAHAIAEIGEGVDHCFDCRSEVAILESYLHLAAKRARAAGLQLYPPRDVYTFASDQQRAADAAAAAAADAPVPPLTWSALWALLPDDVRQARAENVAERVASFSAEVSRELAAFRTLAHINVAAAKAAHKGGRGAGKHHGKDGSGRRRGGNKAAPSAADLDAQLDEYLQKKE